MSFLPQEVNETKINAVLTSLIDFFSLEKYNIVWNDGERSIPEIWMLYPKRRFVYFALLSLYDFATNYTKNKNVLDFGCGVGYGSYYLSSRGAKSVTGLEIDEKSYRYGCDRYKHQKLNILNVDIQTLSQIDKYKGTFDVIYCSNVMEHIADYKSALKAVVDLLSPNGIYIQITPPSGKARGNPYHVTNFTVPEWSVILEDYFSSQEYFAHIPQRDRDNTENEFDFEFKKCLAHEMGKLGSISGIVVSKK